MIKRYQGRVIPYTNLIVSRDTRVYVQKPFSGYSDILARQSGTFFTFFFNKKKYVGYNCVQAWKPPGFHSGKGPTQP